LLDAVGLLPAAGAAATEDPLGGCCGCDKEDAVEWVLMSMMPIIEGWGLEQ